MAKKKKPPIQKTNDGFTNFAAKLGIRSRGQGGLTPNVISDGNYTFNLVTRNRVLLEAAYRGSWIVGRVIDSIAEDMTKSGVQINTNEGAEQLQDFKVQMSRLQIWSSLCDAIKWGRLYGGAIAVVQIDGQNPDTPLELDSVQQGDFKGLVVYDRWQVYPVLSKLIESGPNMGLPAYYDIVLGSNLNDPGREPGGQITSNPNAHVRVHHSRCARLGGNKIPFFQAITEMMWDESVLERLWDRLIEFDTATSSAGSLILRANLRTVGISSLREILAAGGTAQQALLEQFEMMKALQTNEGLTLLDKDDTFATTAYTFSGLSDMLIQFSQQLSGSSEIPLVRLFGQSPAGLNSSGESDIRAYYDSINAKQESHLRNPIEMIIRVMWRSCFGKPAPTDMSFVFTPLWQMSAMDKATIAKTQTALANPALRCQLLVYPMIDATCSSASFVQFGEGFGPGGADMRRGWLETLPPPIRAIRGHRRSMRRASAERRRRLSSPPNTTRCATRAKRMRGSWPGGQSRGDPALPWYDPRFLHHAGHPAGGPRSHARRRRLPPAQSRLMWPLPRHSSPVLRRGEAWLALAPLFRAAREEITRSEN